MKPFSLIRVAKILIALTINSLFASIAYLLFFFLPIFFLRPDAADVALKLVFAIWPLAFVIGLYTVIKKRYDDRQFEQKVRDGKVSPERLEFVRKAKKMEAEGLTNYDRWLD